MGPGSTLVAILIAIAVFAAPARASAQAAPSLGAGAEAKTAQAAPARGGKESNPWTIPGFTLVGAAAGGGAGLLIGSIVGLVKAETDSPCEGFLACDLLSMAAYGSKAMAIGAVVGLVAGLAFGVAVVSPASPSQPQTPSQPPPQLPPEIARVAPAQGRQAGVAFRF